MTNASRNFSFPNTRHIGCHYHFTQSVYRKVQTLGLVSIYRDEEDARSSVRKLMALPLLPLNQIECAFDEIVNGSPDSIQPLLDYFNGYLMTKVSRSLWNHSHSLSGIS